MPSTTRGSILISTANDIGEALVEKLGGVGYSPNEWKEKINLCGIAPVDSAPALSVLSDSAGTGDERGSILIATADAIGAILNKKYNVLRGFKPKEWASACRKMKALEEGSVASSSIASFSDGADDVPTKSLVVTIPPTLTSVSSVTETQTGRNLVDGTNFTRGLPSTTIGASIETITASTRYAYIGTSAKGANYTISSVSNDTDYFWNILIFGYTNGVLSVYTNTAVNASKTVDFSTCDYIRLAIGTRSASYQVPTDLTEYGTIQLEVGSTAHDYEHFQTPTVYTAQLGRTIYGGTVDVVKGEGKELFARVKISELSWSIQTVSGRSAFVSNQVTDLPTTSPKNVLCDVLTYDGEKTIGAMTDKTLVTWTNTFRVYDTECEDVTEFLSTYGNGYIVYQLKDSAPTDFTFTGQEIPTRLGYNAFWSDSGDTAVEYYQAPTPYARKTATGGIANFSDQRTDLPLTKAIANIAPSIAGKSAVNLARAGKNLFDKNNPNEIDGYITTTGFSTSNTSAKTVYIPIIGGATYTVSKTAGQRFQIATAEVEPTNNVLFTNRQAGNTSTSLTITASANDKYLWAWVFLDGTDSGTLADMLNSVQIEVGSSASDYVPYQAPTTYTAELGETVYGGSVDFVSGKVVKDCTKDSMSSSYLSGLSLDTYIGYEASTAYFGGHPSVWVRNWNYQTAAARTSGGIKCACDEFPASMNNTTIFSAQYRIYFDVNGKNISSVQDFIDYVANLEQNGKQLEITYEIATPTESAIPGRVISPIEGVNNYWNDAGGDTEIQYFENET